MNYILSSLEEARATLEKFLQDQNNVEKISTATALMINAYQSGGAIFSCGNGGSLCDAQHFAEELTGRYRKNRKALAAASMSEPGHLTCVANDFGYQEIYSRYLEAWGNSKCVLLAISTSGNSENIIRACEEARQKGMKIVGLLGKDGGKLKDMCDVSIVVSSSITDRIQEIHIKIIHIMIEGIERSLFPENYV